MSQKKILFIEAFYGGSHKQLIDQIFKLFSQSSEIFTMTAKKWHWRGITSPLYFARVIPKDHDYRVLFTSSVLPLAELIGLRPDLAKLHKIVYFHENQLVYPVQIKKERYFQHGYNDVLTCLAADKVIFNSKFNKESFLSNMSSFFNVLPDYKPKKLDEQILSKCEIAYFPVDIEDDTNQLLKDNSRQILDDSSNFKSCTTDKLHIVWPHRWEHDKDPETFFSVMYRLKESGEDFYLSVIGETFSENPAIFEEAERVLKDNILNWGFKESKHDYYRVLQSADVVVSTAKHEFFGVSMLEAIICNCYPLCPKRLAYPELYPDKYLYNTTNQLYKRLKCFCKYPKAARDHKIEVDVKKFSWQEMKDKYKQYFIESMT